MKLPKIFNLKKFTKKSGKLLPITFNNKFPIRVKRIFVIYGKKNYIRGDHAHKKCSQVFIPINGKIKINMKYKNTEKNNKLNLHEAMESARKSFTVDIKSDFLKLLTLSIFSVSLILLIVSFD